MLVCSRKWSSCIRGFVGREEGMYLRLDISRCLSWLSWDGTDL